MCLVLLESTPHLLDFLARLLLCQEVFHVRCLLLMLLLLSNRILSQSFLKFIKYNNIRYLTPTRLVFAQFIMNRVELFSILAIMLVSFLNFQLFCDTKQILIRMICALYTFQCAVCFLDKTTIAGFFVLCVHSVIVFVILKKFLGMSLLESLSLFWLDLLAWQVD